MNRRQSRFIIHSMDQAHTVMNAVRACDFVLPEKPLLLSHRGYARIVGAPVFKSLIDTIRREFKGVPFTSALDCDDAPGHAMSALREAVEGIVLNPAVPGFRRIMDIAERQQCVVHSPDVYHGDVLDMSLCSSIDDTCRRYLDHFGPVPT